MYIHSCLSFKETRYNLTHNITIYNVYNLYIVRYVVIRSISEANRVKKQNDTIIVSVAMIHLILF